MEKSDSQPARFWTYLVTAVQRAVPEVGGSALALLATGRPPLDGVLATLLNELSSTQTEVATYLNDVAALELTPSDIAALETRTEGWVAALQLAALSLRGRGDAAAFIAAFAGDDRYIVDSWPKRCSTGNRCRFATSCSRPPSSTG